MLVLSKYNAMLVNTDTGNIITSVDDIHFEGDTAAWNDDLTVAVSSLSFTTDYSLYLWDLQSGEMLDTIPLEKPYLSIWRPHTEQFIAWSPIADKLLLFSDTHEIQKEVKFPNLEHVVISPDGAYLIVYLKNQLKLYDIDNQKVIKTLKYTYPQTRAVAWSTDGQRVLLGGQGQVLIYDLDENTIVYEQSYAIEATHIAEWSFDERFVLLYSNPSNKAEQYFYVIDLQENVIAYKNEWMYEAVALNPLRNELAAAEYDDNNTLLIYDLENKTARLEIPRERFDSTDIAFSPDGNMLVATYDNYGTIDVWDSVIGISIAELETSCCVNIVQWSQDGQQLYAIAQDSGIGIDSSGTTSAWDMSPFVVTHDVATTETAVRWGITSIVHNSIYEQTNSWRATTYIQNLPSDWVAPGVNSARYDVDITLTSGVSNTCSYRTADGPAPKTFIATNAEIKIIDLVEDQVVASNTFYGSAQCDEVAGNLRDEHKDPPISQMEDWLQRQLSALPDMKPAGTIGSTVNGLIITPYEQSITATAKQNANVRPCPQLNNDCAPNAAVTGGQQLQVYGEINGDSYANSTLWFYIQVDGVDAFIHSSLVTLP